MKKQLALASAWLIGVGAVSAGGFLQDGYRTHVLRIPEPQPYPLHGVMQFVVVTTIETVVLWAIIRPSSYQSSWGRALAALLLLLPITLYFGMVLMHAPPYQAMHFLWSVALSAAVLIVFLASAVQSRRSRQAPNPSIEATSQRPLRALCAAPHVKR